MKIIKSTFVTLNALPKISDHVYKINGKKKNKNKNLRRFFKEILRAPFKFFAHLTEVEPLL